jgi:hypothetical protein
MRAKRDVSLRMSIVLNVWKGMVGGWSRFRKVSWAKGMSQGLKPKFFFVLNARTEVRAYLRNKDAKARFPEIKAPLRKADSLRVDLLRGVYPGAMANLCVGPSVLGVLFVEDSTPGRQIQRSLHFASLRSR